MAPACLLGSGSHHCDTAGEYLGGYTLAIGATANLVMNGYKIQRELDFSVTNIDCIGTSSRMM